MNNRQWENAVNREFIEELIKRIDVMKTEFEKGEKNHEEEKQYYNNVGRMVCEEFYDWFDKDLEVFCTRLK